MVTSVHLFVGAAIGKATGNVYITIPIAFISHYFLDAIPHYSPKPVKSYKTEGLYGANKKDLLLKSIEPLAGICLLGHLIYINNNPSLIMAVGAFFGWLPDLLVFLDWKFNINVRTKLIRRIEEKWHKHIDFAPGIILQIVILFFSILYILH